MAGLTIAVLAVTAARCIIEWGSNTSLVAGELRLDAFALTATLIACLAASVAVLLAILEPAAEEAGFGAFYALLLGSVLGMTLISQAQNLIAFFVALELLSIPLYVLCASARRTAFCLGGIRQTSVPSSSTQKPIHIQLTSGKTYA